MDGAHEQQTELWLAEAGKAAEAAGLGVRARYYLYMAQLGQITWQQSSAKTR